MQDLTQMKCVACRTGTPTVTEDEISEMLPEIPDWDLNEINKLLKVLMIKLRKR